MSWYLLCRRNVPRNALTVLSRIVSPFRLNFTSQFNEYHLPYHHSLLTHQIQRFSIWSRLERLLYSIHIFSRLLVRWDNCLDDPPFLWSQPTVVIRTVEQTSIIISQTVSSSAVRLGDPTTAARRRKGSSTNLDYDYLCSKPYKLIEQPFSPASLAE